MRTDKKPFQKADKKTIARVQNRGVVGYSNKSALLEEAITHMNTGKYGRSSAVLKELLVLDPHNTEARRLFATLHLRLGSLVTARQAFESLAKEAIERQDLWLAESLLREYLAAGPRCVPFLELLAYVYEEKGDVMAAVAELGKAIEILIEDPDSENPTKPSQLYAKVRELAPVSPVAFQFDSLFDIQTGDLLVPHPPAPAAVTSLAVDASHPQGEILVSTEESSASSDVMPWEQFEEASKNQETLPPTSTNPIFESLDPSDVLIDQAPVGLVSQELEISPSESAGPIQEANRLDQGLAVPLCSSNGHCDEDVGDPIVDRSSVMEEERTSISSNERSADVGRDSTPSVESPVLSSPMPWEQIENSTIRIEDAALSTVPLAQSEQAPLLGGESALAPTTPTEPEVISDQLSSLVPVPDLTEPSESIFGMEPSTIPAVGPESEVPTPSAADSSSTVPFSWDTVFDDALKFSPGTLSLSSPATGSMSDAVVQNAEDVDSVRRESVPDSAFSSPPMASTPEQPRTFSDPEPLPSAHPSTVSESMAGTPAITESDLSWSKPVLLSEVSSLPEESPTVSSDAPSSFRIDLPTPSLPESVEPARESKPVAPLSFATPESEAVIPEAPPVPEPVSAEHPEAPVTLFKVAAAPPLSVKPSEAPSRDSESNWSTGEVEAQTHRPSEKKQNWNKEKGKAPIDPPTPLPLGEEPSGVVIELSRRDGWESASSGAGPVVEAASPHLKKVAPQEDARPEWVQASESITFVNAPPPSSGVQRDFAVEATGSTSGPALSVPASDVDVFFDSTGAKSQIPPRNQESPPRARPRKASPTGQFRKGISSFIGSCFSTTRSIVLLCVGLAFSCVVLAVVAIGAIGLAWMVMEAPPSPVYQSLTASPPRALTDSTKNGYFLLLGFDVSEGQDPLRAGYERKVEGSDLQVASACMVGDDGKGTTTGASANAARGWFTSADPVAQLKLQTASVRSWAAQEALALRRYQQWLSMPFEDVGYGQILSPNCAHILLAHRLYLAEGFTEDFSTGLERLETDMRSWRKVLGESKTLMVKMLATTAVQDDAAIASGLLTQQDLDEAAIGRLSKIVRPLDQVELTLQWPMQSHLVWATKVLTRSLKGDKPDERPLYVALAAAMPLPVQRRSNAYADYYEAASKAVAEGRYTNLPKPSSFIRTPAVSVVDYVANPIEHIIGIEPLPSWDPYVGRTMETDARLRLVSLQAWLRQGAQDGNVVTRLAKAGQAHYDPFTGLPMLLNQQRGVMYSVGQDGKDQAGDPRYDVVATIPRPNRP